MCSKHTRTSKKLTAKKYPQKRKLLSKDTISKLNKIIYCQNRLKKNKKCNAYIPIGSPERQKHHIIPLSKGGTNNYKNILICCIDCHYLLHQQEFEAQGLSLGAFRTHIYFEHEKVKCKTHLTPLNRCRKAWVGVNSH